MWIPTELFGRIPSPKAPPPPQAPAADGLINELQDLYRRHVPDKLLQPPPKGPNSRHRVYSLPVVFWTFFWQVLNPASSCREAVRKVQAWFDFRGWGAVSEDDSPYCQARKRLPLNLLQQRVGHTAQRAQEAAGDRGRFHDREVIVADGTTLLMPDTPANQKAYPQPSGQKPGCGFPLMKLVGLFSLVTGALLTLATGNLHPHELTLLRQIWHLLRPGMIVLADRGFCDFVTLAGLLRSQIDTVLRLHQARRADFRQGQSLGPNDRLVTWRKPRPRAQTATAEQWAALPDSLALRLVRYRVRIPGFRTRQVILATTLLDPLRYPPAELAALYLRRWSVELFFRDLKTTLKMDMLRCKSPAMVQKEVWMHLVAYNLLRCLMVEASVLHDVPLARISFKGSLDTLRQFSPLVARARHPRGGRRSRKRDGLLSAMRRTLAQDRLPDRPNRVEPRAVKRRPKPYALLTCHRRKMKVPPHRSKYRKNRAS